MIIFFEIATCCHKGTFPSRKQGRSPRRRQPWERLLVVVACGFFLPNHMPGVLACPLPASVVCLSGSQLENLPVRSYEMKFTDNTAGVTQCVSRKEPDEYRLEPGQGAGAQSVGRLRVARRAQGHRRAGHVTPCCPGPLVSPFCPVSGQREAVLLLRE